MKTMRNEYRDLKKENDLIFSTLAEYDRDTITEIISVVDNTRGIGYEIELIRKDLIAMAAQAEARRDYLPSVIGDVDVFKRNLLASMPKPKFADYMADSLVWLCTFALVSTATYTVMGRPWDCHYDAVWLVLCIAIMMPSAWLLQRIVPAEWAASTEKGVRYGAITAAMLHPTGLNRFAAAFPDRVFDVGIAEQHAVVSAAGLARAGVHPVVAVYATFLNRAFDQILMDVALHGAGVTFALDRLG